MQRKKNITDRRSWKIHVRSPCVSRGYVIRINYSRSHLFGLKSKYFVPPELFLRLKEIGILKTHRTRAGCRMSSKISPVPVIALSRSNSSIATHHYLRSVNRNNLLSLRNLKLCEPNYVCKSFSFTFSVINARSVRNKALEFKEMVVDNSVYTLAITETRMKQQR